MIRTGDKRIGRSIVKNLNVSGIYLGPKLVWLREIELLQMFKASVIADGGIFDEELFTTEFFRVHQTIRNEAIVLIVCGAYKAGIIYGVNCITGQAVPFTFGRLGVGTYIDKYGVWRSAGSNLPRIDYEPETFGLRGYLFENSGINTNSYSTPSNLGQMNSKGGVSVISSLEPDFANEVVFSHPDFPSTTRYWYLNGAAASLSIGNTYTLTAIVKANFTPVLTAISNSTPDAITMRLGGGAGTGQYTYSVKKLRNNIWIVTATRTVVEGDNLSYTGILGTIASIGQVFSVLYAGIENGAYRTSILPTTGSQGTRASDSLVSQSDLISDAGSTIYMEGQQLSINNQNMMFHRGGTGRLWCHDVNPEFLYMWDGTNLINRNAYYSNGLKSKIVGSFKAGGQMKMGINGSALATGPYDGTFGSPGIFQLAINWSGRVQSHLRAFAILHRQLTDAEHIALTA